MNARHLIRTIVAGTIVLAFALTWAAGQTRPGQPPEYKELVAAFSLKDAAARLKEFERIKAAYPNSQFMEAIENGILNARIDLAETLEAVLSLQKDMLAGGKGPARLQNPLRAAYQVLDHPKLASFDRAKVLAAVLSYQEAALKAASDPSSFEGVPEEQRGRFQTYVIAGFWIPVARARLNAGQTAEARKALEAYRREGGPSDSSYQSALGLVEEASGRTAEAYEAFLSAAAEGDPDATDKAKALYVRIHGRPEGFEAALEAKLKALPFHPEPFSAPSGWKGKAVLAELFTGSECPPCVGADLGFDALLETVPATHLVVLAYHLPIPRPDPMMNPTTKARQDYYGVNSTPTAFFDGTLKMVGGGGRGLAETKYKEYRTAIERFLPEAPGVGLKVGAVLDGDKVRATFAIDKAAAGADALLVLVQGEEIHKGGNGLVSHKMVVRDVLTVDPAGAREAVFDLAASERATDAYLTEFERTYDRVPNFKWEIRRHIISRKGLKVALFVQDRATKKVLNAVVAEVR